MAGNEEPKLLRLEWEGVEGPSMKGNDKMNEKGEDKAKSTES
jgi:hypothetical protein